MQPEVAERFSAEEALASIAGVAQLRSSLRSRFEGMTWILWGLVAALQSMTWGFIEQASASASMADRHATAIVAHLWVAVGIAASIGVWRAAAVSFDPGVSRARALAFFVGWPALFAAVSYLVSGWGGGAFRFAIVTGVLLALFALVDPVRYTPRGRWTAAALAVAAFAIAAVVVPYGESGHWFAIAGTLIGLTWVGAGLDALYRG